MTASLKLECAHCIQERITEGRWDRFGTTAQQELEATCMHHLIEIEKLYRGLGDARWEEYADKLAAERTRRDGGGAKELGIESNVQFKAIRAGEGFLD